MSAGSNLAALVPPRESVAVPIDEPSRVGEARRAATALAATLGLSETQQSNLAIVVTEAANNLLRHAGSGEIVLRGLVENGIPGVQCLALDKGPGIADFAQSLKDGYSTGGTSGTGLGAIRRLSSHLDIYTHLDKGTVLLATVWARPVTGSRVLDVGVVNRPKPGQDVCGDSWAVATNGTSVTFAVVDGLGHGPEAAQASGQAISAFVVSSQDTPGSLLQRMHTALQGTRGAAAAVARLTFGDAHLTFAGVGNIAGVIVSDDASPSMVSHYGIVGFQVRKIQEFTYPCPAGSIVILSSDGIATLRTLSEYPRLLAQPAMVIAGVLYRDFQRTNDDSTILVLKAPDGKVASA